MTDIGSSRCQESLHRISSAFRPVVQSLVGKARKCQLTGLDFAKCVKLIEPSGEDFRARSAFVQCGGSWAVYTKEYMNSLEMFTEGKTVLEVAAGNGLLGKCMPNWICTDANPIDNTHVLKFGAVQAIQKLGDMASYLFVSWWPYEDEGDVTIVQEWVLKRNKTMIVVGEGEGGCTGSSGLFHQEGTTVEIASRILLYFIDVPQWPGLHDKTYIIRNATRRK